MKKLLAISLAIILSLGCSVDCFAEDVILNENIPSSILIEAQTGKIIYENNAHISLPPASITKIMTMLLICEAIERGELTTSTVITASERAKSMGGSTIFLDTNEQMTLDDLLKGIAVASANDACVAVAEHMSGSIEAFAEKMNERAKQLGMKDTHFVNCNGLDDDNHYTSAYDIAVMSRELLKHKMIFKYTTIWMDSLRDGKFTLSNTNKLIRFYPGANGLKTGSTSKAGCCISASAKRDGMQLIAVVLGAPNSKERFASASNLLNYGFSNYGVTQFGEKGEDIRAIKVINGKNTSVIGVSQENSCILLKKAEVSKAKVHINVPKEIKAPVKKNQILGEMIVTLDGETISKTNIVAKNDVAHKNSMDYFKQIIGNLIFI